jgi:hypothetical protein
MKLLLENWRKFITEEKTPFGDQLFGVGRELSEPDTEAEKAMWENIYDFLTPGGGSGKLSSDTITTLFAMKKNIANYPDDYKKVLMPPMKVVFRGTKLNDDQLADLLGVRDIDVMNQWYKAEKEGFRTNLENPFVREGKAIYKSRRGAGTSWSGDYKVARDFAKGTRASSADPTLPPPLPSSGPPPLLEKDLYYDSQQVWGAILYAELSKNPGFILNFNEFPDMKAYGENESVNLLPEAVISKIEYWPIPHSREED